VGAGYAGLSAARELGAAGRSVLVVDAHPVGWGASTRNGGMVIPELKAGPAALARAYGPLGGRMYAEVNEAFDHVEALAAGPGPEIPCDYARTGQLYLAHAARLVPGLEAAAREHGERGEAAHFVPREALAAEIGSTAYHGAVVYERKGGLHPARFHAGLVRRAVAAGVKVAMGTDSGVTPHGRNLAELELMAKGGMEPAQALAAATSSAAELLGVADELGTLEPGKRADVVVVDGDPFELATLGDRIAAVVKDGRLVAGHV